MLLQKHLLIHLSIPIAELLAKEKARREAAEKKAGEAMKAKNEPALKMIPRPKGSAGDGFNLRMEMGLEDKEQQYNAILVWTCLIWVSLRRLFAMF